MNNINIHSQRTHTNTCIIITIINEFMDMIFQQILFEWIAWFSLSLSVLESIWLSIEKRERQRREREEETHIGIDVCALQR